MPLFDVQQIDDKTMLRAFLETDKIYAAFALADLEPPLDQHATWHAALRDGNLQALALVYTGIKPPALFLMGDSPALNALLLSRIGPDDVFFTVKPDQLALLETWYTLDKISRMHRMRLAQGKLTPSGEARFPLTKLTAQHVADLNTLFKSGSEQGEEVVAFSAEQVRDGFFFGVYLEEKLIAAAGTHFVDRASQTASLGNVFTHPEFRDKGLGNATSRAVTAALFEGGLHNVILNVAQDNQPALKIYEGLGYERSVDYIEGPATRR